MADSLLKEVDEALRADRAAGLWHSHKKTIVAFIVALILGTAANSAWQHIRHVRGGETLSQLIENQKRLDGGKFEEAAAGFAAIASDNRGELRALAQVWQSRALVAAGKKDEAVAVLKSASEGKNLWSDIACLRLAGLNAKEAACLNIAQDSPLASERAQWNAANAWGNGERDKSIAGLEKLIADESTSQETRARLMQWQASMKAQQGKK